MKITTSNYSKTIKQIGLKNLPSELYEAHHFLKAATDNFKNWNVAGSEFHEVRKLAFEKLQELIVKKMDGLNGTEPPYISQAKEDAKNYPSLGTEQLKRIYRMEIDAKVEGDATPEESKIRMSALEKELKKRDKQWLEQTKSDFGISGTEKKYDAFTEIGFIRRFLDLNKRVVYKNTIEIFIDELQKAILEKKIRKFSPFAKEVNRIQKAAIKFYELSDEVNRLSIDPEFVKQLEKALVSYENSLFEPENHKPIKPVDLSGIGQEPEPKGEIMSSVDFTQKEFSCLGFTGKWLNLIGDPSAGFTAMVFGKPKMGKSFLCVDFAGYLARNFGKVLYVAKEEKLDRTLQEKLKQKDVAHENLFVSDHLPDDLSAYDFIFLDSVNLLGFSPEDLRKLKENNPGKSFVFVFQTTKTGNFRGENTFQHDVDIVIEIPERGKAVQFGRFNQGGEMEIFDESPAAEAEELDGTPNKKYPAWTKPKYMDERDHRQLRHIYDLYKQGKFKQAMEYTSYNCDTAIREEIPGEIWKKMGGELTPSGEERLKAKLKSKKTAAKPVQEEKKNKTLVFHGGTRTMKEVLERAWDLELTDSQYIELLDLAQEIDGNFVDMMDNLNHEFNEFFTIMKKAIAEWENKNGTLAKQNRDQFQPEQFADRSDDENPVYLFSMTSNRVLVEALRGDFDLIYLVRKELANRGLDTNGKWVGFKKAEEIHRI